MAKQLVVYYSRTGTTRQVAEEIAKALGADIEEIHDTRDRTGVLGWLSAGRDATARRGTTIEPPARDPRGYDLVLVGTPVWAFTMSCAVRAYLEQQRERLPEVAFFLTTGGTGAERTFKHMAKASGRKPRATLALKMADVRKGRHGDDVKRFVAELTRAATG